MGGVGGWGWEVLDALQHSLGLAPVGPCLPPSLPVYLLPLANLTARLSSPPCRQCKGNSQARAMLAVSVILFALLVVALFARSWEFGGHGPGIMTKVKIFLTHFQVRAKNGQEAVGGQ